MTSARPVTPIRIFIPTDDESARVGEDINPKVYRMEKG